MTFQDVRLDATKLIKAFMNNGLPERDAWDAAFAYKDCLSLLLPEMSVREFLRVDPKVLQDKIDEMDQEDYNTGAYEEMSCWED